MRITVTKSGEHGGLELDDVMEFQRRSWRVQRVGWMLMAMFIVAALAGLFGNGPVAHATAGSAGSLFLRYDRFNRLHGPHSLEIDVSPSAIGADSTVNLWMDREWLAGNEVMAISPVPARSWNSGDKSYHAFRLASGVGRSVITISMISKVAGRRHGRIGLESQPPFSYWQFTYP